MYCALFHNQFHRLRPQLGLNRIIPQIVLAQVATIDNDNSLEIREQLNFRVGKI